jgi:hypothetical protein
MLRGKAACLGFPKVDDQADLNTLFSFTRRDALQPTYGPSNLQNRWRQVNVVFVRPASMQSRSTPHAPVSLIY